MNALNVILDIVRQGGPVMIVLVFAGIWVWYLLADRSYVLRHNRAPDTDGENRIIDAFTAHDKTRLAGELEPFGGLYADLVRHLWAVRSLSPGQMKHCVDQFLIARWPRMNRGFSTIRVLAAVIPLLGLLGTVTGMVRTFDVITLFGSGNPVLMAGGISEALLTTQSGLVLAFPVIIFLVTVNNRKDRLKATIEHTVSVLLNKMEEKNNHGT